MKKLNVYILIMALLLQLLCFSGCGIFSEHETPTLPPPPEETFWTGESTVPATLPEGTSENADVITESSSESVSEAETVPETVPEAPKEMPKLYGTGDFETDSESYCVIDEVGQVWIGKNELIPEAPASITKVMTALVTVDHVGLDDVVTVREEDLKDVAVMSSGVSPSLRPGEQLTVRDLLYALILPSTNAAGSVLATYVAGSKAAFADMMNSKAAELGLSHSHFMNPHGLDEDGHYSCAYDMCVIMKAAMASPYIRPILSTTQYTIPATAFVGERSAVMGHQMISGQYACEGVTGGKPGWTVNAQATLVTAFSRGGQNFYVCTMHSDEGDHYRDTDNAAAFVYGKAFAQAPLYHAMIHDIQMTGDDETGVDLCFRAVNGVSSLRMVYWNMAVGTEGAVQKEMPAPTDEMHYRLELPSKGAYMIQLFYNGPTGEDVVVFSVLHAGSLPEAGIRTFNGRNYLIGHNRLLLTGAAETKDGSFYTDADGGLVINNFAGGRFYMGADGTPLTGWQNISGSTYYFQTDGRMATGRMLIEGTEYNFTDYGALIN